MSPGGSLDTVHELTGDVAAGASGVTTIQAGVVGTSKLGGDITTAGKALLDDADAAAQRTTLGLAAIAASGSASDLGTGTLPIARVADGAVTLAKLANVATARFVGRTTAGSGVPEELTGTQATAMLDACTATVKGLVPAPPNNTTTFLRGDGTFATPAGSSSPAWYTKVAGAYGDGSPHVMMSMLNALLVAPVSPTPTNITTSVARISYFRLPCDLTVNKLRYWSLAAVSSAYSVALYRFSDLARLTAQIDFNTPGTNQWGSAGSSLGIALTAGTLYFLALSVRATGTTAGIGAFTIAGAANTPQRVVLPSAQPGNLATAAGFAGAEGQFGQFAVTTGALPNPAATIAIQAAWTGGMPGFFLDNSNA